MSEEPQDRLESWKEIGAYLQRDARTVRRWEKEEGLPVHRHGHRTGSSVYAYPSEIDAWRAGRKVVAEPAPPRPLWKIPAFALTMLLCLVMVGNGVRPVSAQAPTPTARQLWRSAPGHEVDVSPDSRQLAYLVSVRPGAASFLAVMPAAGGPTREVFRGTPWMDGSRYNALTWTGDQRYLVFARGGVAANSPNVLWRVPVTGGQPEPLGVSMPGQIRSPQMRPDGRRIFFSASRANAGEVWALDNFLPKTSAR